MGFFSCVRSVDCRWRDCIAHRSASFSNEYVSHLYQFTSPSLFPSCFYWRGGIYDTYLALIVETRHSGAVDERYRATNISDGFSLTRTSTSRRSWRFLAWFEVDVVAAAAAAAATHKSSGERGP